MVQADSERNLLLVKGSVPGYAGRDIVVLPEAGSGGAAHLGMGYSIAAGVSARAHAGAAWPTGQFPQRLAEFVERKRRVV